MANTFAISRSHLMFGLCLPLAVLLGYMLAEPLDSTSLSVFILIASVLAFPVLIKCHHPLLIFSWNACITPFFIPGRPALWMLLAGLSLFLAVLQRSVSERGRFLQVPTVTRPLLCLLLVVVATALVTGGFGNRVFGSRTYGGKGYFVIGAAVMGYFALTSQAIPRNRALLMVAVYLLAGVTAIVSNLVYMAGPKFYILYELFPTDYAVSQANAESGLSGGLVRLAGLVMVAQAIFGYLLARYGLRGVFDLSHPWRLVLMLAAIFLSLYGGYRTSLVFFGLTFLVMFFMEGLWRTRVLPMALGVGLLIAVPMVGFIDSMPQSVQRTLSFLPLDIDPAVKQAAEDSTQWRLEMWKVLWPDVPKYLFKGKGYALDAQSMYLLAQASLRGYTNSYEWAAYAGDYHNGLLSVVIPFGIYGLLAFLWFLAAGIRLLYRNFRYGDPWLRQVNAYLLAFFVARAILFFLVFGAFYSELFHFTGALGLSVALNHGECRPGQEEGNPTD